MLLVARAAAVIIGFVIVGWVLDAAIRTFMLPRPSRVKMTRWIGNVIASLFGVLARRGKPYEARDRVLAMRPPITLLTYQAMWLLLVFFGFTLVFWGVDDVPFADATRESGSALFTLGFASPVSSSAVVLVYLEAFIGLTLLALLISYLPTIYAAFQKREFLVSKLTVRAGPPPRPWHALAVAHRTGTLQWADETMWGEWENWFIDIAESHTSLVILNTYRSPNPADHWLSAARCALDLAALRTAVVDLPVGAGPSLTLRAGSLAFRTLADYFRYPYPRDPKQGDPISITREQFDAACRYMSESGVPLKADLDQAWLDFAGWRVNYDVIIEGAAVRFDIPPNPWDTVTAEAPAFPA